MKTTSIHLLLIETEDAVIGAISAALQARPDRYLLTIAHSLREARDALSSSPGPSLIISSSDGLSLDFIKTPLESVPWLLLSPSELHPSGHSSPFLLAPFYAPFILPRVSSTYANLPSLVEQILCEWKERRFQSALLQSELRLQSIVQSAPDAIVCIDEYAQILLFNPAAEALFGLSHHELLSSRLDRFFPPEAQISSNFRFSRILAQTYHPHPPLHPTPFRLRLLRSDQSVLTVEASISSFHIQEKRFFSFILRDLSERIRLEEQWLTVQKMESVGRLAGAIAHDFNNLLSVILASADLTLFEPLPDEVAHSFSLIQDTAERGAKLTKQLLSLARGAKEPVVKDICLNKLLDHVEDFLRVLLGKKILLAFQLDPTLPTVRVDPDQIEQILFNLAANARDAMPDGGTVTLRTSLLPHPPPRFPELLPVPHVELAFEDTGIGIPSSVLPRIFEPFFTTKDPSKGTGLGLPSSYRIARQHQGHLYAESIPSQGCCFFLLLPLTSP